MSLLTDLISKLECLCRKADALEARVTDLEEGGGGGPASQLSYNGTDITYNGEAVTYN